MSDSILVDTNLWVYLYANTPCDKHDKVKEIIDKNFENIICSTQVLGELYHVLTRKRIQTKDAAKNIVNKTINTFPIIGIDTSAVKTALDINSRYGYSYWDSLLIATAVLNSCQFLYSEDMQHNQLIKDITRIINPFNL